MEKKKALLIVTGGRAVPDVLTLLWLKPQLVTIILSERGWGRPTQTSDVGIHGEAFVDLAKSLPNCQINIFRDVDVYDLEACLNACSQAYEPYPASEWDWTCHITSSPKVLGIAAYEVARKNGIPCWVIDTTGERIVSMVQPTEVDKTTFFHLTLTDYMSAQGRTLSRINENYRQFTKQKTYLAETLVNSPETTNLQSPLFWLKKQEGYMAKECLLKEIPPSSPLVDFLQSEHLLAIRTNEAGEVFARFASLEAADFIGTGDWLEFYVWNAIIQSGFANEEHCQWGREVLDGGVTREFDLLLMYMAQLIVGECKAEREAFKGNKGHLHKLRAKADVLGGSYVSKLFITNQSKTSASYAAFCESAKHYETMVVAGEDLSDIAAIIKEKANKPDYQRI
ncbi:Card1-like endonuclease domain-containing protein [Ktedonobacter racemifer]|uniref:Card1 endonuclease domain-containing protein n=1 Tax=Ktedonobacter racemifer DSM 44963 TaxID=485913 RepID=D6TCY1_KTERA|nr:DUF1887 family CARF protein [Ktedonobacter racemifer]EFH90032.1 hypothetical protein Krac_11629 [Ktedonobacter racemifer DSM 44963]